MAWGSPFVRDYIPAKLISSVVHALKPRPGHLPAHTVSRFVLVS
jgi:hypothetical protein